MKLSTALPAALLAGLFLTAHARGQDLGSPDYPYPVPIFMPDVSTYGGSSIPGSLDQGPQYYIIGGRLVGPFPFPIQAFADWGWDIPMVATTYGPPLCYQQICELPVYPDVAVGAIPVEPTPLPRTRFYPALPKRVTYMAMAKAMPIKPIQKKPLPIAKKPAQTPRFIHAG